MRLSMDYAQAVAFLESLTDYEKSTSVAYSASNYDLRRMLQLLQSVENPHEGRRTVHIAGTKGKGSTAVMISGILKAAGFKTGMFSSPHLFSWQERIAINGHSITQQDFARLLHLIEPHVISINEKARFGKLTTFEVLTAVAFCHFREKGTHFQVLETGMGGRLDATNVVEHPDVCIITSISLDHTQVLGYTPALIAAEKAGIIKPGCTVISAPQLPEAAAVIEKRCSSLAVPLLTSGRDITWQPGKVRLTGQSFRVHGIFSTYDLRIPLLGDYQMENTSLAVAAAEVLQRKAPEIGHTQIVRGLSQLTWPARLQVTDTRPLLIIDGAHNSYSLNRVIQSVRKHFQFRKVYVIFGSSKEKDIEGMAKQLSGFADSVILARSDHPRAATVEYLAHLFRRVNVGYEEGGDVSRALLIALAKAEASDLILAIGSLFLAADVQKQFKKIRRIRYKKSRARTHPRSTK